MSSSGSVPDFFDSGSGGGTSGGTLPALQRRIRYGGLLLTSSSTVEALPESLTAWVSSSAADLVILNTGDPNLQYSTVESESLLLSLEDLLPEVKSLP